MSKLITVSGKGGTGKTTFLALVLKSLIEINAGDILLMDGDPDSAMTEALSLSPSGTIGQVMDDLVKSLELGRLSPELDKIRHIDTKIFDVTVETDDFDFVVVGPTESDGCYCPLNHFLAQVLEQTIDQYDITLLDLPAGLEHLNRRVVRDVDGFFVITDGSSMSFATARRIQKLISNPVLDLEFHDVFLIGNQLNDEASSVLQNFAQNDGWEVGGVIPHDPEIQRINLLGPSLLDISNESPGYKIVNQITRECILKV